ncbi:glycosyltransferase, partial [Candidatus Curtissbacteria bacterium]|nr:glycosyltransferase [Candidatus Curtissbacteria bacterium]
IIVGDGNKSDYDRLKKIITFKNQLKIITKHISEDSLIKIFQSARLLCIGAYKEPFGLTSVEAQACGTPVVLVNDGGLPETVIHNKSGYISPKNELSFKKYCEKALKNFNRMSKYAQKCAKEKWSMYVRQNDLEKIVRDFN